MTDKLEDIEADLATTNPDAVAVTIPRKHMEWLIAEVKRLRWFEENFNFANMPCPFCDYTDKFLDNGHTQSCEYIEHKRTSSHDPR